MGNEYATEENNLPYVPDLHTRGSISKTRKGKTFLEFWMSRPRPEGVSIDEWDRQEQEKWNRIFGNKTLKGG